MKERCLVCTFRKMNAVSDSTSRCSRSPSKLSRSSRTLQQALGASADSNSRTAVCSAHIEKGGLRHGARSSHQQLNIRRCQLMAMRDVVKHMIRTSLHAACSYGACKVCQVFIPDMKAIQVDATRPVGFTGRLYCTVTTLPGRCEGVSRFVARL